jgi:hypothetical protein
MSGDVIMKLPYSYDTRNKVPVLATEGEQYFREKKLDT